MDLLTGTQVIRKSGPAEHCIAEARALLHAPPGVAPRLLDFEFVGDDRAALTMERLAGSTLLQTPPPIAMAGPLALAISECLARFHRLGLAHCDIKPSNILLEDAPATSTCPRVRLLDLGHTFAFERGGWDERPLGGSHGYVAPEIVRGWRVDARADQFSLAVTILDLFPTLRHDPLWSPLLERLGSSMASRRFRTILEFARELAAALNLPAAEARPSIGGGAFRGREALPTALLAAASRVEERRSPGKGAAVLIHGAPHCGLSRGLLEGLIATPEVRWAAVDLGELFPRTPGCAAPTPPVLLPALLNEVTESGTRLLLVAIGEPGPQQATARVLDRLGQDGATDWIVDHVFLDRLSASDFAEVVAMSLGHDGPVTVQVSAALHERWEGDLRLCAPEFARMVDAGASDGALGWIPCSEHLCAAPPPEPSFGAADASTQHLLAVLARAGTTPPVDIARTLLAEFCSPPGLPTLLDAGWVRVGDEQRLQWISARAHQAAFASPPPNVVDLDRWLAARLVPDIQRPHEIRECVARLHRLGGKEQLRALLSDFLERAVVQREFAVIRALLDPPDTNVPWTRVLFAHRTRELAELLGPAWPHQRLGLEIARSLAVAGDPLARELLAELAEDTSSPWGIEALLDCAARLQSGPQEETGSSAWERVEALARDGRGPDQGRLEYERGRRFAAVGEIEEARAAARRAAEAHQGTGSNTEVNALAFLGYLEMPGRPDLAAGYLERACESAKSRYTRLIMMLGLSQVLEASGELRRADEALRTALGLVSADTPARWQVRCRVQLGWIAVLLGRTRDAGSLIRRLADAMEVRRDRNWHPAVRMSAALLALYSGDRARAVAAAAQSCELLEDSSEVQVRSVMLRMALDIFLDLGLLSELASYGGTVAHLRDGCSRYAPSLVARWEAASAQAEGNLDAASTWLEGCRVELGQTSDALERGRYHHHVGLLLRQRGDFTQATGQFRSAADLLEPPGFAYFAARSRLMLADCLWRAGEVGRARESLASGLRTGKALQFPLIVADGLRMSALWESQGQ
ncbi:MAG: hypothetical protein IT349_18025 [Candidatus Eisenbacteria bacterium]|nr:hypothetical protein [Candidatus Eisenbacteria bacterium]